MKRNRSITVLAYHRIEAPGSPDLDPGLVEASPEGFEAQVRYLARAYNVVSTWDLARALRDGYTLPPRALAITFDDGYRSFKDVALPILARHGLPVTLFVATHHVSNPMKLFWWDELYRALKLTSRTSLALPGLGVVPVGNLREREAIYRRLVARVERTEASAAAAFVRSVVAECGVEASVERHLLGWEELASLAEQGVTIGPHSRHHPVLSRVIPSELRSEVAGSWADLRRHVPSPVPLFCYPNGKPHALSRAAISAVRDAGLAGAFTMVAGLNVAGRANPYLLHRVGLEPGESLPRLALKLTPLGHAYRLIKQSKLLTKPS